MKLLEPILGHKTCNRVLWGKVLCILVIRYLIVGMQCHIYTYCKVEIYLSSARRVPIKCSRLRARVILRLSYMLVRLLNNHINDFWSIIHSKQSD
jgi:hypothetical protein